MEFSSSFSPQDNGRYHCVVWFLNAETKELVIIRSHHEVIHVSDPEAPPIIDKLYLLPVIIAGVMLVIVIGTVLVIFVYRKRAVRHADRIGEIVFRWCGFV